MKSLCQHQLVKRAYQELEDEKRILQPTKKMESLALFFLGAEGTNFTLRYQEATTNV